MTRPFLRILFLFLLTGFVLFNPAIVSGQFYNGSQLSFGKNRVQYTERFWSFYRFDKFDVYYYINGKQLAVFTARYADRCLKSIERKLDYTLEDKIQFIIFNKYTDLLQSNIGHINEENYNTGGITHIVGSKVFIYFDGSYVNFEKQIRAGITKILLDEMMYGGRITAMIKNSALLSLPQWYTQGLISFISDEWNAELENIVKDGILSGSYKKYSGLSGPDAVYAGHSIWKFIDDKYGPTAVSNIIYLTRVSRNVESGFLYVLGISFKDLIREWLNYYEVKFTENDNLRSMPEITPVAVKQKKGSVVRQLKISPDGKYCAYVNNIMGQYRIWLLDLETGKHEKLMKKEHKMDEKTDNSFPLLAWHPSSKLLAIITETRGKIMLYYYTLEDGKFEKQQIFTLEKVLDFSFSHNGKLIVFSGVVNGQSDIYVYSNAAHTYEPITKDIYDDMNPRFTNNSTEIIFSSNRPGDSIAYDIESNLLSPRDTISYVPDNSDIFLYDYAGKNPILRRLTNTPHVNETHPYQYDRKYYAYLSDQNGIINRYLARIDSTISFVDTITHYRYYTTSFCVSDYKRSILEQDILIQAQKTGEIFLEDKKYKVYIADLTPVKELVKTQPENTFFRELYLQMLQDEYADTSKFINQDEIELLKKRKGKNKTKKMTNVLVNEMNQVGDTGLIDINNYSFGNVLPDTVSDSGRVQNGFQLPRQENYNVEYSINQLVGQIDFNYLNATYQQFTGGSAPIYLNPGFNVFFQLGIIDLMEDYRISGGARISLSFDNNEFFIGFENLKKRLDKSLFFYHLSQLGGNDYSLIKLRSNSLYYILKWPFSRVFAIKGTISGRYDRKIYASTDIQNLKTPDVNEFWGGIKGELVYDNTQTKALNIYYGWRWKIFGEYYQQISNNFNNLIVLGMDFRHYQKLHRNFIWANRLAASTSFGNSKLVYYLGGVDNWIIPRFNSDVQVSQNENYAYQTLATNMRGFRQNIRNGNNFAVFNSELRFPVFSYFSNKPIKNDFFANFQIVGFGDVGTAWTGWNLYSDENTLSKQIIQQGPITVTLIEKRNPIVGGFGAGLRTKILGYFIRADYAWGVENGKIQKPVFYVSLSLDF